MDATKDYNNRVAIGENLIRATTREKIKDHCIPLALLYEAMVKRKEIEPLGVLTEDLRRKYWNETAGNKLRRIWTAESLYMWDLITLQPIH